MASIYSDFSDVSEESEYFDFTRSSTRSSTRRERIQGLGIDGVVIPSGPSQTYKDSKQPKRHVTSKRSIVSLLSNSRSARASASASRIKALTPPPVRMSPTVWRESNPSSPTFTTHSSEFEDISTFRSNLARFKAERAERAAELGLSNYDLHRAASPGPFVERSQPQDESLRKTSSLSLGRGLRTYWGGGGSSSSGRPAQEGGRSSKVIDPYWNANADKGAFREWWDRLGEESVDL